MENVVPIGWKLATEWHIVTALFCYGIRCGGVDTGAVARSRQHRLPHAVHGLCGERHRGLVPAGEAFNPTKLVGMGTSSLVVVSFREA